MLEAILSDLPAYLALIPTAVAAVGIWHGIHAMDRVNKGRGDMMAKAAEADERRHDEAMTALADQRREAAEAAEAARQEAAAQRQEAASQRRALEALIERTAPKLAPGPAE